MTVTVPMGSTERDALGKKRLERGVHGGVVIYEIATVYWLKHKPMKQKLPKHKPNMSTCGTMIIN